MKKLLAGIGMFMMWMGVNAQTRVIDYPVHGKRMTESIEFYQVEVSDTAVILKGDMYSHPKYWVKLASSSVLKGGITGKKYRLIRATGIELDKEEYMPESWNRSFTLEFEPVDIRDTWVDFDESLPGDGSFMVNGIFLEEKKDNKKYCCHLGGQVIDNPAYSRIVLIPEGLDARVNDWISIPVRNGKFSYDLYLDEPAVYEIYAWSDQASGSYRPVPVFVENGKMDFTLYSLEKEVETESDILLNEDFFRFKKETDSLFVLPLREERRRMEEEGKIESVEMQALHKQFNEEKDEKKRQELGQKAQQLYETGKANSPEYEAFRKKSNEVHREHIAYTLAYIQKEPTLVGLYLLKNGIQEIIYGLDVSAEPYIQTYNEIYSQKFPNHTLSAFIQNWISSREIKVGKRFIDFTAPDLTGVQHTLSKEIGGKVALIDLWASWCGPCRRLSMSMIPVYEAYKDKGFTVVGVARERNNAAMQEALVKDKYPWLNLLELNDVAKIWEKYGVGNGGGCTYLVDREGKILAIHPTAEEVKAILDKML